jgi:hypothetical protein
MNITSVYTPQDLFAEIGPREFADYRSFERTIAEHFSAHTLDFPSGYGLRDLVEWALRHRVVRRVGAVIEIVPPDGG